TWNRCLVTALSAACSDRCHRIVRGDRAHCLIEKLRVHLHEMTRLGKPAFSYIGDIFAEGRDALFLQAAVLCKEIAVSLGMTWRALFVVAENVVGEKKLRVATVP